LRSGTRLKNTRLPPNEAEAAQGFQRLMMRGLLSAGEGMLGLGIATVSELPHDVHAKVTSFVSVVGLTNLTSMRAAHFEQ
jgi:hypothetical protein